MEKNLSFILDNVKVYTDMCLVRDEMPIFFTCIDDEERYYLALCTDMDRPQYCVIRVTMAQLNNMLQSMMSMKKIFTLQKKCWVVSPVDNNVENDKVLQKNVTDLAMDELPNEDAYFELFNDELKAYAKTINKKMIEGEFVSTIIDGSEILNETQEGKFNVSFGKCMASVFIETCDTTEIKKKMVLQEDVLHKYNKEGSYEIVQTNYSVENPKKISNKILGEEGNEDLLLVAA